MEQAITERSPVQAVALPWVEPVRNQTNQQVSIVGVPSAQEWMVYQTWAKSAVDSQMYRGVGKESAIMMIMLAAREYGIGPAQALNGGLHIIEGNVELSARMMSALIRRAKHTIKIIESTDTKCTIMGRRADTREEHTVTFTIEMAQKAGLIKEKGGWKKNPEDMLYARAISRLARQLFSDVIGIGYVEGEMSDSGASGEVLEATQEVKYKTELQEDAVEKMLDDVLKNFQNEDHFLVHEFVKEIQEHYKEAKYLTLMRLLKDAKSTVDNFHKWKSKRKV